MNRPGTMPQPLRGMSGQFVGQQQVQQQQQAQQHQQQQQVQQQVQQGNRVVTSRLPNGKLGGIGSQWFGGGLPMGMTRLSAQQHGANVSFAQSVSGSSQPGTPLDLSEFPSLSNNPPMPTNQASMWSSSGSRSLGGQVSRNQMTPTSSQSGQPDDMFTPDSGRLLTTQGGFRYGNTGNLPQSSLMQPNSVDDFPPLNKALPGDFGQDRGATLMSALGFGSQVGTGSSGGLPDTRIGQGAVGNGLLNAVSANARSGEARSPTGLSAPGARAQDPKGSTADDEVRQKPVLSREENSNLSASLKDGSDARNPHGTIGNEPRGGKLRDGKENRAHAVVDPLTGMSDIDKWGLKGLRTLMDNYPDYRAMVMGMDPSTMGLDMTSTEMWSTQLYSLFDNTAPRPVVGKFRLPECYKVTNVAPIEGKIPSFNEETLFWIFYSCTQDMKQQMAAVELHSRNWRWHKKLRLWLTKDAHMTPQVLGPSHERGFYVVWDTLNWAKDRRELTLNYGDLDTSLGQQS